ncbi:MAG TPA: hypothetical protein VIV57_20740 [Anaeromyxobacter sp.]
MRALVAAFLALGLAVVAAIPHGHPAGQGGADCTACVARHGDVARSETPDVAPQVEHAEAVVAEPGIAPVTGAPLGAIPGQSPPAAA